MTTYAPRLCSAKGRLAVSRLSGEPAQCCNGLPTCVKWIELQDDLLGHSCAASITLCVTARDLDPRVQGVVAFTFPSCCCESRGVATLPCTVLWRCVVWSSRQQAARQLPGCVQKEGAPGGMCSSILVGLP